MSDPLTKPAPSDDIGVASSPSLKSTDGDGVSKPIGSERKQRSWIMATLPVAIIAAFAELGLAIVNNEMTVYLPHGLGLDAVIMANVMMPFFLSEILFKSPLGVLADRWGRKPLMVIGPAISIFTPIVLVSIHYPQHQIFVPYLLLFGFLRLLDGLGAAALWPAMFAYIGDQVREEKRASAMSLLNVTYMLGLAFGFLAGGWANDTFGPVLSGESSMRSALAGVYRGMRSNVNRHIHNFGHIKGHQGVHLHLHTLANHAKAVGLPFDVYRPAQFHPSFYLGSVLFALATIVAVIALRDRGRGDEHSGAAHGDSSGHGEKITWPMFVAALKTVPHLMLIAFVVFAGIGCIMLLVKNYALDELGVSETDFGLLVLWPAIIIGALAVPLGHCSDKFGKVLSVRVGFCIAAFGMWCLVATNNIPNLRDYGLLGGASLLGIGFVLGFPAWMALLTMIGGKARRGTIVGAVSTAQGIGSILGLELGAWLYSHASLNPHLSHAAPFLASAIFLTVATLLTFLLIKREQENQAPETARSPL